LVKVISLPRDTLPSVSISPCTSRSACASGRCAKRAAIALLPSAA